MVVSDKSLSKLATSNATSVFHQRKVNLADPPFRADGYTLILPSISYGNVGQLAVDLLLATCTIKDRKNANIQSSASLISSSPDSARPASSDPPLEGMERLQLEQPTRVGTAPATTEFSPSGDPSFEVVGSLMSSGLVPIIGADPFGTSNELCTAADVYANHSFKHVIVQLRSAFVPGGSKTFVNELIEWIKEVGISSVICLTSSFSFARSDADLRLKSQIRWAASPAAEKMKIGARLRFFFTDALKCSMEAEEENCSSAAEKISIPGGGFAGYLLRRCCKDLPKVGCVVLMRYCSEGDNAPDAGDLANHLAALLEFAECIPQSQPPSRFSLSTGTSPVPSVDDGYDENTIFVPESIKWKIPPSWRLLYGCRVPESLMAL